MDTAQYYFTGTLSGEIATAPDESIISRTFYRTPGLNAMLFSFAPGQSLSEHAASMPAMVQILEGEVELGLGTDVRVVGPGAWAYMPARLSHSVKARTAVKMLLVMLPPVEAGAEAS